MKRFVQTFDGIITVDATKSLSNLYWKLLLTIMTTLHVTAEIMTKWKTECKNEGR